MPTLSFNAEMKARNSVLVTTLEDMLRKNHLPTEFRPNDPGIFSALDTNWAVEPFKAHSCMECGITIYGPKKLLLEHHKTHVRRKEIGENEVKNIKYLEYST